MRPRFPAVLWLGVPVICLLAGSLSYFLPPIHDRLAWRVENLRAQVKRAINPPEQVVFIPQEQIEAAVQSPPGRKPSTRSTTMPRGKMSS